MATKNYMINDKWLDLDKQNIVELQSVDGEIDKVFVNGEEAGSGGFSVITVKMINATDEELYIEEWMAMPAGDMSPNFNMYDWNVTLGINETREFEFIIPKNLNDIGWAFTEYFTAVSDLVNCYINEEFIFITDTSQNASFTLYKD